MRASGKISEAGQALQRAAGAAQTERITRPFIEARPALLELLDRSEWSGISWLREILDGKRKQAGAAPLTRREREILELLAMGLSNHEMAEKLFIAEGTLKRHVANLYQKLGVHNRAQAVRHFHLQ